MKKIVGLILLMTILLLAACGQEETNVKEEVEVEEPTTAATEEDSEIATIDERLKESEEGALCEYCQMEVYDVTTDLGAFTAQGIKSDGSNVFFDDVGCMLNQERIDEEVMEKFVRDYNTNDWISLEEAIIVKAEIKTPMNYGYAFFKEQNDADQFMKEHAVAEITEVAAIDHVAHERHMKKMEKMKNGEDAGHMKEESEEHETEETGAHDDAE